MIYFLLTLTLIALIIVCVLCKFYIIDILMLIADSIQLMGLDYASGLVDNYLYGYLNIVLPDLGTEEEIGIPKRLKNFKEKNRKSDNEVPCNKLIILLPSSGFSPPLISGHHQSFNRIESAGLLEGGPVICRNGITKRTYQTALYSIVDKNGTNKIWIAMEFAPFLATLNEACRGNSLLNKRKPGILKRCAALLQQKIEMDPKVRGTCEIFYWDDSINDFNLPDELLRYAIHGFSSYRSLLSTSYFPLYTIEPFKRGIFKKVNEKGLGYVNALIDNYFYGYLKIVLPNRGTSQEIGIRKRLQILRNAEFEEPLANEAVPYNKLIVLVPSTGSSHHDISEYEYSFNRIQLGGLLVDEPVISRYGIKKKSYQTPVHRVKDREGKNAVWVVMEFASFLATIKESCTDNPHLNQLKQEIVKLFVTILQQKLNIHDDVKNKCEIIYFNESDENFSLPDEIFKRIRSNIT